MELRINGERWMVKAEHRATWTGPVHTYEFWNGGYVYQHADGHWLLQQPGRFTEVVDVCGPEFQPIGRA